MMTSRKPKFNGVAVTEIKIELTPMGIHLHPKLVFVDEKGRAYGITTRPKMGDLSTKRIQTIVEDLKREVEKAALKSLFHAGQEEEQGGIHNELPRGIADGAEEVEQF